LIVTHTLLAQSEKSATGSISGTISEAKSKIPIPRALLVASRVGPEPLTRRARSGGDGEYQLRDLAPGNYWVCVQAPSGQHLDSCDWGGSPVGIVVGPGGATAGIDISLAVASVLDIQLADPQGALRQLTKDGRRPELLVGVWGPGGLYYPAHVAAEGLPEGSARVQVETHRYQLKVPRDTQLTFQISSRDLRFGDATGMPLSESAGRDAFRHGTGEASPKKFSFTVLGKVP